MLIIGCDFHPGFQQVAIFDNRTGEIQEKRLQHCAEAEQFYRSLAGQTVRVGMEACGHYPWFERLLEELGFELWRRLAARKNRGVAKVAVARKLATRLYLMLREQWTYTQLCQAVMQVSPSHSVVEQQRPTASVLGEESLKNAWQGTPSLEKDDMNAMR